MPADQNVDRLTGQIATARFVWRRTVWPLALRNPTVVVLPSRSSADARHGRTFSVSGGVGELPGGYEHNAVRGERAASRIVEMDDCVLFVDVKHRARTVGGVRNTVAPASNSSIRPPLSPWLIEWSGDWTAQSVQAARS